MTEDTPYQYRFAWAEYTDDDDEDQHYSDYDDGQPDEQQEWHDFDPDC